MNADNREFARELAAHRAGAAGDDALGRILAYGADEDARRASAQERDVRTAWRVTAAFGALALAAFAVAGGAIRTAMRPAPPPEIMVVERAAGKVEPLVSLASYQANPDETVLRSYLTAFMRAREGYSYHLADDYYYSTGAFLCPKLKAQWVKYWDKDNPQSPPRAFKPNEAMKPEIGAITLVRNEYGVPVGARVGLLRHLLRDGDEVGEASAWIATIEFGWTNAPTTERDRRVNPLGLQVCDYSVDRDPASAHVPAPAAAPAKSPAAAIAPTPATTGAP
jgi:type IV secretion system protein VirB8